MNKKYLSVVLFGALLLGTAGTFTSCKDYDDDIENLQDQITAIKGTVDELKAMIASGYVIDAVNSTADGVTLTFKDNKHAPITLTNGKDGKDGKDGKPGTSWEIKDGNWWQDGKDTGLKAVASDGAAGKDGCYYKPNTDGTNPGNFDKCIIENGKEKVLEHTTISYISPVEGVSVVWDGRWLIIDNAENKEGGSSQVKLMLGEKLASIAFVPEYLDQYSKYPLAKFYHVTKYWDPAKYNSTTFVFIEQNDLNKSNEVAMTYRVNPKGAYVDNATLNFINRTITQTKAIAGDNEGLLKIAGKPVIDENAETMKLNALYNVSKKTAANEAGTGAAKFDLVALQAAVGTEDFPVTSDYIAVRSELVTPILVDRKGTTITPTTPKLFFNRNQVINTNNPENDAFVKQFVPAVASVTTGVYFNGAECAIPDHLAFPYKDANGNAGSITLIDKVGLYVTGTNKYLDEAPYNMKGIRYEFSLPAEYKDTDAPNNTNQQWFVKLTDKNKGVVEINTGNLVNDWTPAIGRKPVVRVDAYLTDNKGAEVLYASAYIRLEITRSAPARPHEIALGGNANHEYHSLPTDGSDAVVVKMPWTEINNKIYGVEGLNATNFWNYYGGATNQYTLKVVTYDKTTGAEIVLMNDVTENTGSPVIIEDQRVTPAVDHGMTLRIDDNTGAGMTSAIQIGVNNKALTENTYKDMGNGAKYKITITIKANDNRANGDFILTQDVNVLDDCKFYTFNPLYHFTSWDNVAGNYIIVKGKVDTSVTPNTWKMTSQLSEHFKMINNQNIFAYYSNSAVSPVKNVEPSSLKFQWVEADVRPQGAITTDQKLYLNRAMTEDQYKTTMNYEFSLINGETCDTEYNVIFLNPFVAGTPAGVSLYGNSRVPVKANVAEKVIVNDRDGDAIYEWDATAPAGLKLTPKANTEYKVATPGVTYAWDMTDTRTKDFINNLSNPRAQLQIVGGEVIWDNDGATLGTDHTLQLIATVTFTNLSTVKMTIPVTIKANNN